MPIERDEVKLMIETAEMRIAASIARMEERDLAYKEDMSRLRSEMTGFRAEIRSDIKSLRRTTVMTGFSAVLAIFFGVSAVNSALLTHFMEGVDAGRRGAYDHEEIRREIRQHTLEHERQRQERAAAPKK